MQHPILRGQTFGETVLREDHEAIGAVLLTAADRLVEQGILRHDNFIVSCLSATGGKSCSLFVPSWRDGNQAQRHMLTGIYVDGQDGIPMALIPQIQVDPVEQGLKEPKRSEDIVMKDMAAWDKRAGRLEGVNAEDVSRSIYNYVRAIQDARGPLKAFTFSVALVDHMMRMCGNTRMSLKYGDATEGTTQYGNGRVETIMVTTAELKSLLALELQDSLLIPEFSP